MVIDFYAFVFFQFIKLHFLFTHLTSIPTKILQFFRNNIVSDVEKDLLQKGKFKELLAHQEMMGQQQEDMVSLNHYWQ